MPNYYVKDVFIVEFSSVVEADDRDTALFEAWDHLSRLLAEIKRMGKERGIAVRATNKDNEVWETSND